MKKLILFIILIATNEAISQTATASLTPQMVNTMGGSGVVAGTYYDFTVGEPITLFGGISTGCDSIFSGFQHCAIDTLRINKTTLSVSGTTTFCFGGNVILTAPAGVSYLWSNSATTQTINVTASGNYHVRITNICGDTIGSNNVIVTTINPQTPNICMVTTDSSSNYNYNIVYWTNSDYPAADSFIVYRNIASVYTRLGAVSKDSSHFTDVFRNIGGPNGGDPNLTSYRYTLALRDSCNNLSAQSPYHQTTNVYVNGTNIDWNDYTINSVPALGYDIYRDSSGTNNFILYQSGLTSNQTNVPSFVTYPNQNFRVDPILSYTCDIQQRQANPNTSQTIRQKSHSNASKQSGTMGLNQVAVSNQILIYPNPASNSLNINCPAINNKTIITIYDATGSMILQHACTNGGQTQTVDIQNMPAGMYFIEVGGARKIITVTK